MSENEEGSINAQIHIDNAPPRRSDSTSPRRQRTASESGVADEVEEAYLIYDNPSNDNNANTDHAMDMDAEPQVTEETDLTHEESSEDTELGTETEGYDQEDSIPDTEDEEEENDYYSDYNDEFEEEFNPILGQFGNNPDALINRLQSMLMASVTGGGAGMNAEALNRIRQMLNTNSFIGSRSTHSPHINSILMSLHSPVDPMNLFSIFTQLFELIVLTGEELEMYEFDSVINLKVLLPHLLKVIRWDDPECQVYGTEFLLIAIKCTRAIVQYSPASAKRLVDSGLIPLITFQLLSVEYIDLAEDLIQIICILSKNSNSYSKACLHADGIKAALGFIDFFALPVQINALTAVAQMATALTRDTFDLYFTNETIEILHLIIFRYSGDSQLDNQELKAVNGSLNALHNALTSTCSTTSDSSSSFNPYHSKLFPIQFIEKCIIPLSNQLPLDTAKILFSLTAYNDLKVLSGIDQTIGCLLTASKNEEILEITIKLIFSIVPEISSNYYYFDLFNFIIKTKARNASDTPTSSSATKAQSNISNNTCPESLMKIIDENLMKIFTNSAVLSSFSRHLILSALLLINSTLNADISLEKAGFLVQIISDSDASAISKCIGLEWCLHYSASSSPSSLDAFKFYSRRQGLTSELINIQSQNVELAENDDFIDLITKRLESFGVTIFSGDEGRTFGIYTNFIAKKVLQVLSADESTPDKESNSGVTYKSLEELFELLENDQISFTEYELLGGLEGCECKRILILLKQQRQQQQLPVQWRPGVEILCKMLNNSFNRYDSHFKLINSASNRSSMQAFTHLGRPVQLQVFVDGQKKILACDPFSTISWIAKMSIASEAERRRLLSLFTHSGILNLVPEDSEVIDELESETVSLNSYPSRITQVLLKIDSDQNNVSISLEPSSSLAEVLFKYVIMDGEDGDVSVKIKKISEIWNKMGKYSLSIFTTTTRSARSNEMLIDSDDLNAYEESTPLPERLKLALDLLALLPSPPYNSALVDKLTKELNSTLLIALNSIPDYWIRTVIQYPLLFPFELRVSLMRATCYGRLRALNDIQSRNAMTGNDANVNGQLPNVSFSMPRLKFKISRDELLKAMKITMTSSDSRVFEFEYEGELGSGHGPTLEFYTMAANEFTKSSYNLFYSLQSSPDSNGPIYIDPSNGYFPNWKCTEINVELFELLGCFIARAWLDHRIFDLPLHELFLKSLLIPDFSIGMSFLEMIDPVLCNSIRIVPCDGSFAFMIPGTDIALSEGTINSRADRSNFESLFMAHVNKILKAASAALLRGFSKISPKSFQSISAFFTIKEVSDLISPPLGAWSVESIISALATDHGYHKDSPQIRWLAEIIADLQTRPERAQFVQFLTGAAFLPIGGWNSLQPRLTIVCKTFDSTSSTNLTIPSTTASEPSNFPSRSPELPSQSSLSDLQNHDIYLPSVMTCANYLKLPRYSSKEIMLERFNYAIKEASGTFYLS